jgi:hypothetical protein
MWRLGDSQAERLSIFVSSRLLPKVLGRISEADMVSFKHLFRIVPMILASRCFAESLYLTTPAPLPPDNDRFVFIAPYFAELKTHVTVSISQGAYNKELGGYGPPVLTISVIPVPVSRGFLYLTKNPFFSDAANVSVSSEGLLSSSDSSSAQQITAILTELAQTAAVFLPAELELRPETKEKAASKPSQDQDDRKRCMEMIKNLVTDMAFLVAFYPVPSVATLNCRVGRRKLFELTPPQVINLYTESHLVDPQRDFFSNPQDSFTFSSGFVTGHKYAAQSPAKTIVDTVTAPVRALMPSVTITTSLRDSKFP